MTPLRFETTGRLAEPGRFHRFVTAALAAGALVLFAGPPPAAAELRITVSNDLISGSREPDDLYTAEVALEGTLFGRNVRFGERMFTRREADRRFDETYLDIELGETSRGGWRLAPRVGLMRIGSGLLGERAQNEVHDLVGAEPVDLRYIDDSEWFATGGLVAERPSPSRAGWWTPWLELAAAPGFRETASAGLRFERDLPGDVGLIVGAGAIWNRLEEPLLRGAVRETGPLAEVGIGWRGAHLRFAYNEYGTRGNTITLGVDPLRLRRPERGL